MQPLATRRPFDDPGVKVFHYRLMRDDETLLQRLAPFLLAGLQSPPTDAGDDAAPPAGARHDAR